MVVLVVAAGVAAVLAVVVMVVLLVLVLVVVVDPTAFDLATEAIPPTELNVAGAAVAGATGAMATLLLLTAGGGFCAAVAST